ncbi:hypothetical protein NDU88_003602 [Pleurodeles waltl]|uniref:Uncharacterized protein n=1 Tax=Pleurodeles waltl TaxID=8319 RepID=A0AAV7TQ30_PLEWA|nr:hypothetical protein NDU88_003602 [Pleurodeles waltl]
MSQTGTIGARQLGKTKPKSQGPVGQKPLALLDQMPEVTAPVGLGPEELSNTLSKILGAIEDFKLTLQRDIGKVAAEVGLLRTDHQKLSDKVLEVESTVTNLQPSYQALQLQVSHLADSGSTGTTPEDTEGRSLRNNICIVGLPEGIEGRDMVEFLEPWLRALMDGHNLMPFFALERAHHVPAQRPHPGIPPQPVVAKLLHYHD